jgi:CRISPR-associated endonuclease/helicase Cas3
MPGEAEPGGGGKVARGIRAPGDRLLRAELGGGEVREETPLSLEVMEMGRGEDGGRSWGERMRGLLAELGPFRLAYLEMLLRAADARASARGEA